MTISKADVGRRIFHDDDAARAHLEGLLWPKGPICPHCRVVGEATLMNGKSHRAGLYNCRACQRPFTLTIGTMFENSKVPLHKWVLGMHLMAHSKKGISARQLEHMLELGSYRTAWAMAARIREALRMEPMKRGGPRERNGGIAEADGGQLGAGPRKTRRAKRMDGKRNHSGHANHARKDGERR